MRVALDVSALSEGLRNGTAVYLYRLCEALSELAEDLDLELLYNGQAGRGEELARSLERDRIRVLSHPLLWKPLPAPLFWRPYPRVLTAAAHRADVFHVGEFVYPVVPAGHSVTATVHDCTTVLFPEWHGWANRWLHRRRLRWIAAHARRIIIDAEATRGDTARVLDRPPEMFDVVPLARGATMKAAPETVDVRGRFQLGAGPIVLFVGTLEPRKNLVRLVEAFLRLPERHREATLVLAGHFGWHGGALRAALARAGPRVVTTGGIDAGTLHALYRAAEVFVYPSLYEGFGLPVLEAMAAGVPVITSAGGALAEVAGDAALLVDAASVDAIAAALDRLLGSPELRSRLRAAGQAREQQYTWRRTAERTLAVWRQAAGRAA